MNDLQILGLGTYVPPSQPISRLLERASIDPATYRGWRRITVAGDDEHPADMAHSALADALESAGVHPRQLRLVLSCGVSRDYPPSWSVATEVMRRLETTACFGFDLTIGCLGVIAALEVLSAWLRQSGGGYGALVAAERWSHTVRREDHSNLPLWGHSDGAGAMVVGLEPGSAYRGACFASHPEYNDLILVKYGGTRFPIPPPDEENPFRRHVRDRPKEEIRGNHYRLFETAHAELVQRFGPGLDRVVVNQTHPGAIEKIGEIVGVELERVCVTGHDYGHLGSADLIVGLDMLRREDRLDGRILLVAGSPYAAGLALIVGRGAVTREHPSSS